MTSYSMFAIILDYPERSLDEVIRRCAVELDTEPAEVRLHLLNFQTAMANKHVAQIQEIYTAAFDLRPDCTPNLGYHLFGDDARRGVFLAELKRRMEARGIRLGNELPDHLPLVLKYLDAEEEAEHPPLIEDCLLPALTRMIEVLRNNGNPYEHALQALVNLLQLQRNALSVPVETTEA